MSRRCFLAHRAPMLASLNVITARVNATFLKTLGKIIVCTIIASNACLLEWYIIENIGR